MIVDICLLVLLSNKISYQIKKIFNLCYDIVGCGQFWIHDGLLISLLLKRILRKQKSLVVAPSVFETSSNATFPKSFLPFNSSSIRPDK